MNADAFGEGDFGWKRKSELDGGTFRNRTIHKKRNTTCAYIAGLGFLLFSLRKFHSEWQPKGKAPRCALLALRFGHEHFLHLDGKHLAQTPDLSTDYRDVGDKFPSAAMTSA